MIVSEKMGEMILVEVIMWYIVEFLELWIVEGKNMMVGVMRFVLFDIFCEVIVEGRIIMNLVELIWVFEIKVVRECL